MRDSIRTFLETELLSGRPIADDEDLLVSGLLDSLAVMRLVAFIEGRRERKIPAADVTLGNFATLDQIIAYLERTEAA